MNLMPSISELTNQEEEITIRELQNLLYLTGSFQVHEPIFMNKNSVITVI